MYFSPYMTERTLAQYEGRAEKQAVMMHNRKPYRTAAQKRAAREKAVKCKDGAIRSIAPVSYHPAPRGAA